MWSAMIWTIHVAGATFAILPIVSEAVTCTCIRRLCCERVDGESTLPNFGIQMQHSVEENSFVRLDFCDEPAFSKISMFIKGREWLDEKEKIVSLAGESMPKTYAIRHGKWADEASLPEESTLFFLKEAEKNGGKAVQVYRSPAECLANATDATTTYVVQGHVAAPMLTNDGHKCHVKVYCLLRCSADDGTGSVSWTLYTCKDCYLSVASKVWSPTDVSHDAQITTLRNKRLKPGHAADNFKAWPGVYGKCQSLIADIVGRAIDQGRLRGREEKAQYEIFSADFILDESEKLWCIEFNFTPVLYDPRANQPLTTRGLKLYDDLYKKFGDETEIDDGRMIYLMLLN